MTRPSEIVKELAQQCCDEIEGTCYQGGGPPGYCDNDYSFFNAEKARELIENYMLRALADCGATRWNV